MRRERRAEAVLAASAMALTPVLAACAGLPGADEAQGGEAQRGEAGAQAPSPSGAASADPPDRPSLDRPYGDEVIYFVLPDRFENADPANDEGGLSGGKMETGYDPAHKGFYHGGDLAGLRARLDYIQGLGSTALWLGPIYRNKPVQGPEGFESAGYHGYWITDFTAVDPHFGDIAELRALADDLHARGMKLYLDVITNHTADVIRYRECHDPEGPQQACDYRRVGAYPYATLGGPEGETINEGFVWSGADSTGWEALDDPRWAYTPYVPEDERGAKTPDWLNDPIHYTNRGDSAFSGESSLGGDFVGLDDLNTYHPRVIAGMTEVFGDWIDAVDADGFRVDTARHVNPEFWQAWVPAMLARAEAAGRPNFTIFGEVFDPDPAVLARHSREDGFPALIDFAFMVRAREVIAEGETTELLKQVFAADALYEGGRDAARALPTFLGNHDKGRFAEALASANPDASEAELIARWKLGHALMLAARGVPTIYAGSEQGFVGDPGGDQNAREDMFPSRVAVYNDNDLLGTDATTAKSNFDTGHPLYRFIADLAAIRADTPALRRGRHVHRLADDDFGPSKEMFDLGAPATGLTGLYVFSRIDEDAGQEVVFAMNVSDAPRAVFSEVDARSGAWERLAGGDCAPEVAAPASYRLSVPAYGFVLCKADW